MEPNKYLTAKELAKFTGISVATVWRLKGEGKIAFIQPGGPGSRVLFKYDALEYIAPASASSEKSVTAVRPGPKAGFKRKK
ncbi:helix-turn-helix domain-containing protein [Bremerella sp. P1]|uniref:helix-turn-helix domain-containing protein n=1 Tax=Bremerella sp. P1 TaxID=3026424 RepID=UPI00236846C8|nr:helix-turn-helix domain-containing protein [Bremerella sp. P1]WDI41069.1 helix-turn-helix domain-containing protein [Bremerella sp. P1]